MLYSGDMYVVLMHDVLYRCGCVHVYCGLDVTCIGLMYCTMYNDTVIVEIILYYACFGTNSAGTIPSLQDTFSLRALYTQPSGCI